MFGVFYNIENVMVCANLSMLNSCVVVFSLVCVSSLSIQHSSYDMSLTRKEQEISILSTLQTNVTEISCGQS